MNHEEYDELPHIRYGEFTSLTDEDYEFFKQLNEKGFDYALQ